VVENDAILYTIEGIAAGILVITTAYLIISTTTIYTPGDTHISDMQMEQLGYDVLAVMDIPRTDVENSPLETYVQADNTTGFREDFLRLATANAQNWDEDIKFNAVIYYRKPDGTIDYYPFSDSGNMTGNLTGSEHLVKVTRRVFVTDTTNISPPLQVRNQSVLLEVLMWRD